MASKLKVDAIETGDGTGTIALSNQFTGMTVASLPSSGTPPGIFAGGKVLQVAVASISTGVQSTSSTYATTGLNCAITPSSTSSKLLVTVMGSQAVSWDNDVGTILSIFRGDSGGTNLLGGASEGGYIVYASVGAGKVAFPISMQVLDSPSTTSSVDYYMKLRTRDNGNTSKLNWLGGEIYMTVMEIAA